MMYLFRYKIKFPTIICKKKVNTWFTKKIIDSTEKTRTLKNGYPQLKWGENMEKNKVIMTTESLEEMLKLINSEEANFTLTENTTGSSIVVDKRLRDRIRIYLEVKLCARRRYE